MNTYMAHAYVAERERTWTNRQELPALIGPEAVRLGGIRRFRRFLAVLLVAGTTLFGALGPDTGSARALPPCFVRSTAHQMSVRQPTTIRYQHIHADIIRRLYCRLLPGDPLNQNLAVVSRYNA